ncbi:uncharacterized protein kcnk17 [Thalassophryne amazonica]|uniref:uncharacterized protein kcnk17 n=1 Tax=Thalassophryne amazonica TaxID=390379 RepID=UPI001471EC86|nr:uncharacterized protein kcnk17 [Thalassophryne amazonica]
MARFRVVRVRVSWTALLALAHSVYLLIGATVFQILERDAKCNNRNHFQLEKLNILENYMCLDRAALEECVQVILDAWEKGVNPSGNSRNPSNWDFSSPFFFAGTVVTTISYGNLSPSTVCGQVFCVFYALCGIPLNLAFLKQLEKCLTVHLGRLERGMVSVVPHKQTVEVVAVSLFFVTGSLLFLVVSPLLFSYAEGWTFGEGFYFVFITLSTIGFGDYVVGTDPSKHYISVYRSLAGVWIIFALAWLALIFNLGARIMEHAISLTHPGFNEEEEEEEEGTSSTKLEDLTVAETDLLRVFAAVLQLIDVAYASLCSSLKGSTMYTSRKRSTEEEKMGLKEIVSFAHIAPILLLGVIYVLYVLIGGVIFWKLEGDLGKKDISLIRSNKEKLLKTYSCLNQEGLEAVAQVVQDASKVGLSLRGNSTSYGFWRFTSSAVFAATVVTTIGYGNISPSTMSGQIFCVFFALVGIPLNMVVLNRVGKYMLLLERNISDFLQKRTKKRMCTRFFVHLVSYMCGLVLFFVVPMIVFQQHEGWTLSEGIYYCFITLSTIGFGDYVADSNPDKVYPQWYNILMACWIFFGLAWLALIINHSIDILERLNKYYKQQWAGSKGEEKTASPEPNSPDTQMEDEDEIKKTPVTQ